MINKEKFCEIMDEFERQFRQAEEFHSTIASIFGSAENVGKNNYFDLLIKTLSVAMDSEDADVYGYTTIGWWIYEDDFGKQGFAENMERGGHSVRLIPRTSADLWDLIQMENEES